MEKIFLAFIIIVLIIFILFEFFLSKEYEISKEILIDEQLENLNLVIFQNTKFKDFSVDRISFDYPDWKKIEINPILLWPAEIAEKEKILLYLTNPDGVKVLVTKRELSIEECQKPYPLVFREVFNQETKIMREQGGLTDYQVIREIFFENGISLELRIVIFGQSVSSVSKSVIIREGDREFIYSIAVSAQEKTFEDYRLLADYIMDSVRYY